MPAIEEKSGGFLISRLFEAPRERVWKALTEVEYIREWWCPAGFTLLGATMDLRPGGAFHSGMRSLEGYRMWGKFVYREIAEPERLVFVNSFSDAAGGITRHPILPTWPMQVLTVITLEQQESGWTKLTVQWSPENASEEEHKTFDSSRASMQYVWGGTLDRLATYLAQV